LEVGYKFIVNKKLKSEHDGNGLNKTSMQQLKPCSQSSAYPDLKLGLKIRTQFEWQRGCRGQNT